MMINKYISIYEDNLRNSVIPFWLKHSPDYDCGGTYSCLDRNGDVYDSKKYVWLQGRSVWMFSRLYNEYEKNDKYLEIAQLGIKFIDDYAVNDKGMYYFSLTNEGKPCFFQRKVYSAVFCMLAYLEYSKAVNSSEYFEKAEKLFWQIKDWIHDPSVLGRPILSGQPQVSSLADVMVLASMAIELASVDRKQQYLDVMEDALKKVNYHHLQDDNLLIENASLANEDIYEWPEGRLFNPGHSIETAWFILHLLEFLPDSTMTKKALAIIEGSLNYGWDGEFGGLYYFMDIKGYPTLQLESSMKLWWPHTEALYACALAYKKTGQKKWLGWLEKIHDYTFKHFVDDEYGGWYGYCDRRGNLTHSCKGGNYKGFFHVPRFLLMSIQLFNCKEE